VKLFLSKMSKKSFVVNPLLIFLDFFRDVFICNSRRVGSDVYMIVF